MIITIIIITALLVAESALLTLLLLSAIDARRPVTQTVARRKWQRKREV